MAVLGRVLFSSAERVDLVDLLGIDSYTIGDFKFLLKSLVGDDKPFILKGFEVLDPAGAIGSANISVQVADSVAYFPGSSAGPFFFGLPEGNTLSQPLVPELRKNATNFVYLTLSTSDTAKDSRALFDPDANGGDGAEFVQDINTESVLIAEINVSVSSFPANTIPVCKVVVGATSIISIQDSRDLLFRLGSGGLSPDPLSRFSFRSEPSSTYARTETPTTINSVGQPNPFRGADKNIRTWKEWMDVVMTKLAELGGTTYWYQNSNGISNITLFKDALATAVKSKGNWQHDLNTEGLLTWTEDIHLKNALSQFDVIIRAGNKTLPNENVMYIELVRDAAPNGASIQLTWVNGLNYVDGVAGSFTNLAKGDWIKKVDDPDQYLLRVEEFYASPALGGGATSAALAQSIRLSGTYSGTSSISLGAYIKGVYQTSDVLFLPRSSTSLTTNGNMHWLAMRSDIVMNCSNVFSLVVSGTVSDGNGSVAKFTSAAHGLVDGDRITVSGSVNYNGTYEVEVEDANTFYIKTTGTVTEPGVNAYYSLVTTTTRSTAYGLQLESSNHGFKSGDTVKITDTTNYNGTYFINVRTGSSFTFPIPSAPANETAGTATLVSMLIRDTSGYNELVRGEVISIGDGSVVLDGWLGRGSVAEANPNWQISGSYNALDGMESYNALDTDNMTQRVSKLTAMMADKAQDKTVKWLTPSTVEYINKATNGANQDITFTGLPSMLVTSPGSPGGTTLSLSGTLAIPANSAAYFTLGRNSATSVASLNALTISTIAALPISENIFIFAVRGSGTDVWLWDGTPLYEVANYYDVGKQALRDLREDRSSYLRSDSPVTWSGSQLTFTTDIILEILNTKTGTISTHTVLLANSPISLTSGQIAYITINRDSTSENLVPTIVSSLPAQTLLNKDIIVLFRRVDVSGNGYLHIPLHKQVIEPGQTVRLGASGSGSGQEGNDDDLVSLLYKASFKDDFNDVPSATGPIDITVNFTDSTIYSTVNKYYRLSYDASKTVTGTGTAMTISATPTFTVKIGDILRVGLEARRITAVATQTSYTIEAAFSINPSAAACTISQVVYTVDLNNYAGDGQPISSVITANVASLLMTYDDTETLGDIIFNDDPDPVNVAYTASANGSSYSFVTTRPTAFQSLNSVLQLPVSGTQLKVRFFSNKTSGSGQVNLLGYKVFFHRQDLADSQGPVLQQAYCFTDGVGTEINCQPPTVVSSKTRLQLGFSYTSGVNPGTTNGQLEVYLNGQKIPRFVNSTLTPDASYTEVSANTIDLDADYSGFNYSLEVLKPVSLLDSTSVVATQTIRAAYDIIVGSAADVASGVAQFTSIQAAINAVITGGKILVLNGSYVENLSIGKKLTLEGKGHSTEINGTVTFTSSGDYCTMKQFRILDNLTFDSGADANYLNEVWFAAGKTVIDSGTGNSAVWIEE